MNLYIRLFLLAIIISSADDIQAQFRLSGQVRDGQTHDPLIGATLFFPKLQKGTVTDTLGQFRLANLPGGTHLMEIRLVGFKTARRQITLTDSLALPLNLTLESDATRLQEVVVTGLTTGTTTKASPIPIMTYAKIQWLQTASTNLTDAVSKLPGMSQITTGVGLSKPVIRGLGFNRVITVHDGVRQEDNQWGEEHALQVDEYSIDRYEIIKGAGSLLYGSDGLGGVISLLSARPPEPGRWRGQLLSNYQSNNGLLGVSVMGEGMLSNGWFGRVRVSRKSAGNYQNRYDGLVYGSAFSELDLNGTIGLSRRWGYTQLYASNFHNDINIVTGERDGLGRFQKLVQTSTTTEKLVTVSDDELSSRRIETSNYQNLNHLKISSNTFAKLGGGNLSAILSYSQNRRQEFGSTLTGGQPDLYFYLQNVFYDVKYYLAPHGPWDVTIGGNGLYQLNQNKGLAVLYPGYRSWDNGLFVFAQRKTDRYTISGGIRGDVRQMHINRLYANADGAFTETPATGNQTRFAGLDKTYANVTGSLGMSYNLSQKLTLKANMARGFRAPATAELSANGEHAGTFRYEIGNVNQQSEQSFQSDLGLQYETPDLLLTAALFQNSIQHYTYSEKVLNRLGQDSIVDPTRPVRTFRYAQGNALLYGAEAQLTLNPRAARWLHLIGSYSLVQSENRSATTDSARYLPFLPPPRWIGQVKLTKAAWGNQLRNLYVLVDVETNQRQNQALLAYDTETPTPAYTLINLGGGADLTNAKGRAWLSVYVTVQNLMDVAYQSHQNRLKYFGLNQATGRMGVYNMGRNLSLKVVVPFGN